MGRRRVGGGRRVYLGLKRMALAVVSCSAMANGEGGAVDEREAEVREVGCAVVGGAWQLLYKSLGDRKANETDADRCSTQGS